MFGYVCFYFKLYDDKQVAYTETTFDFAKPITEQIYEDLKNSILKVYRERYNFIPIEITSCTKEEYDDYYANKKPREKVTVAWDGNERQITIEK